MDGPSSLLSGRVTRQTMSWLVGIVLLAMPLESQAHDHWGISRRGRSVPQCCYAVLAVMLGLGAFRLLPSDPTLLWETAVILVVLGAGVAVLDVHANRAEAFGATAGIDPPTGMSNRRTMLARL